MSFLYNLLCLRFVIVIVHSPLELTLLLLLWYWCVNCLWHKVDFVGFGLYYGWLGCVILFDFGFDCFLGCVVPSASGGSCRGC